VPHVRPLLDRFGNFCDCKEPCRPNTFNDGTLLFCEQCPSGFQSPAGASSCTRVQPTRCPAGFSGLPDCQTLCEAGTFQDGSGGECRKCTAGFTSVEGSAACNITIVASSKSRISQKVCMACSALRTAVDSNHSSMAGAEFLWSDLLLAVSPLWQQLECLFQK
jgi:hypothetical protein